MPNMLLYYYTEYNPYRGISNMAVVQEFTLWIDDNMCMAQNNIHLILVWMFPISGHQLSDIQENE